MQEKHVFQEHGIIYSYGVSAGIKRGDKPHITASNQGQGTHS